MELECRICGEKATGFFVDNPTLPLCSLASCEVALIEQINIELEQAAEAVKE